MLESDLPSQVAQSKLRAEGGTRKGGKSESAATLDCILEMWAEGGKFEKKRRRVGLGWSTGYHPPTFPCLHHHPSTK